MGHMEKLMMKKSHETDFNSEAWTDLTQKAILLGFVRLSFKQSNQQIWTMTDKTYKDIVLFLCDLFFKNVSLADLNHGRQDV
jgi:hypothetical protein